MVGESGCRAPKGREARSTSCSRFGRRQHPQRGRARAPASRRDGLPRRANGHVKVYLRTFGCRANQYDTEVVRGMIEAAGGEIVASPDLADAAVFNSCAVTAAAEADLRQSVRRTARRAPALRSV